VALLRMQEAWHVILWCWESGVSDVIFWC